MVNRIRMTLKAGLVVLAAMIVGIATMASAQAAPTPGKSVFQQHRTGIQAAPAASASDRAPAAAMANFTCFPPFRYNNAASWNCNVSSGTIHFWITCSVGGRYYSGLYGPGSYYVYAQCPQGYRVDEGVESVG
ncbi:hypothetical protein [Embleya sp. NPDC020630]|uniref:hypothetical protein n=1 Tax=Embleya sp. NPDC020630 TaxID=3363979 RepID=UPI0037B03D86